MEHGMSNTMRGDALSRRLLLQAGLGAAGVACLGRSAAAEPPRMAQGGVPCASVIPKKSSQADARYSNQSWSGRSCGTCRMFLAPDQCVVVEGPVSQYSGCALWAENGNRRIGCIPDPIIRL